MVYLSCTPHVPHDPACNSTSSSCLPPNRWQVLACRRTLVCQRKWWLQWGWPLAMYLSSTLDAWRRGGSAPVRSRGAHRARSYGWGGATAVTLRDACSCTGIEVQDTDLCTCMHGTFVTRGVVAVARRCSLSEIQGDWRRQSFSTARPGLASLLRGSYCKDQSAIRAS